MARKNDVALHSVILLQLEYLHPVNCTIPAWLEAESGTCASANINVMKYFNAHKNLKILIGLFNAIKIHYIGLTYRCN